MKQVIITDHWLRDGESRTPVWSEAQHQALVQHLYYH